MNNERVVAWETKINNNFFIKNFIDDEKGLRIIFSPHNKLFSDSCLNFCHAVYSHRILKPIFFDGLLKSKRQNRPGLNFLKIENSTYLKQLTEASHGMLAIDKNNHFLIIEENIAIEIIAAVEPYFEIL